MTTATLNDDYEEYDEIEDDEDDDEDQGLSGLVVLLMGIVMLGAIVSVVWIAYQHGVNIGEAKRGAPYVTADPEPLKIENDVLTADASDNLDREVFSRFDGAPSEPVEVIAAGPEEPIDRPSPADATQNPLTAAIVDAPDAADDDAVADRIAELAAADAEMRGDAGGAATAPTLANATAASAARTPTAPAQRETTQRETTAPAPAVQTAANTTADTTANTARPAASSAAASSAASASSGSSSVPSTTAIAGTHVVQVAAVKSRAEADAAWTAFERRMGDYLSGKGPDILAPTSVSDAYYRVRVAGFDSKEAASDYCAGLKERGADCLVRPR